jgi:hypothetical protein
MSQIEAESTIPNHPKTPEVIIDHSLDAAPYAVEIDYDNLRSLLEFSDAEVGHIVFKKGGRNETIIGPGMSNYNDVNNTITARTDWAWRRRERLKSAADSIINGEDDAPEAFYEEIVTGRTFQSPERFKQYLQTASKERARKFSDVYIDKAITSMLNSILLHELQHSHDRFSRWKAIALVIDTSISIGALLTIPPLINEMTEKTGITPEVAVAEKAILYILSIMIFRDLMYSINPLEKRAAATQKKLKQNSGWEAIKLVPKTEQSKF